MATLHLENLSPFGRVAVQLDSDFMELVRLSAQIQRLDIQSDGGLDHALKLLNQFAQHGQNISGAIQEFSKLLQEVHQKSEAATKAVAARAQDITQRRQQQNQIQDKMARMEQDLKAASEKLAEFKQQGKQGYSEEEKKNLTAALEKLHGELETFISNAESIKNEASELKFKNLERNALSLLDTLQASRRKIREAITSQ